MVQEYARFAFANIRDFVSFGPDGVAIRDMDDLTPDQVAAVGEVTETVTQTGKTVKFKLHDKLRALDALSRHLGMDAPQKVALTDADGEGPALSSIEVARRLAFLLAKGEAEQDEMRTRGEGIH